LDPETPAKTSDEFILDLFGELEFRPKSGLCFEAGLNLMVGETSSAESTLILA
jgi:hypothetical protein